MAASRSALTLAAVEASVGIRAARVEPATGEPAILVADVI